MKKSTAKKMINLLNWRKIKSAIGLFAIYAIIGLIMFPFRKSIQDMAETIAIYGTTALGLPLW